MKRDKMKVLNFICMLAVGGTERQFVYATQGLHKAGLDMHAGVIHSKGPFLKDIQSLDIPLNEYTTPSIYSYQTLRQQWLLRRHIREQNIDVVHAYGFYANIFSIPPAKFARRPVTVAGVRDTGIYLTPMMRRAQRAVCRVADCVVANSNAVRDWLISEGTDSSQIRVIRNGIMIPEAPTQATRIRIRTELGIPLDVPVVTTVCRITESKGITYLFPAAARVRASMPNVRFLIVGKDLSQPGYKAKLERDCAELKVDHYVHFLGEREDVFDLLRASDLFVLPSLSEGLSNVLLEAMAASLPVVATNVGGNPEVVQNGKTGLLVAPKSSEELTDAILDVLRTPQMARHFGEAGRRCVVTEFSLQSMVRQTHDLYLSLLEQNGRRGRIWKPTMRKAS